MATALLGATASEAVVIAARPWRADGARGRRGCSQAKRRCETAPRRRACCVLIRTSQADRLAVEARGKSKSQRNRFVTDFSEFGEPRAPNLWLFGLPATTKWPARSRSRSPSSRVSIPSKATRRAAMSPFQSASASKSRCMYATPNKKTTRGSQISPSSYTHNLHLSPYVRRSASARRRSSSRSTGSSPRRSRRRTSTTSRHATASPPC